MKTKTIKTIGRFTAHAGKALKDAESIYCQVSDDGRIYVGTGSFILCMNSEEYTAAVQPVTHCDAGNWTIDSKGSRTDKPALDAQRLFNQAAQKATSAPTLAACPILFQANKPGLLFAAYFSVAGNFAAAYSTAYIAAVAPGAEIHAVGPLDPAFFFLAGEPVAMILPVRIKPEQARAVKAYFTEPTDAERTAEKLQNELSACKQRLDTAHAAIDDLREKNDALAAELAAAQTAEVQPEPATEDATQTAEDGAQTAAERIAARWAQVPGITATIKGAQTAAPVVWIAGDTEQHAETIKADGGRWSTKRGAFYFRVA